MRADPEAVDGRMLFCQSLDDVFIDAAAGKYRHVLQSCSIENAPHSERMIRQITAVEAYAPDLDPVTLELWRQLNDFFRCGLCIVGVDQKSYISGQRVREMIEGRLLILVRLYKRVRHCAIDRDTVRRLGQDRCAAGKTRQVAGPRSQ